MNKLTTGIKRLALALCLATPLVSRAASTYSTYKDDTDTPRSGAYGNAGYQRFQLNATWMFNITGDDIAATADAVSLDSITVYWYSSGHNNADIGHGSNEPDPYLVVTTPQKVIVGISAAGEKWSADGSSTFAFTDLTISPNAQYYYYFATSVSSLSVGEVLSGDGAQARFTGTWHGSAKTSDTTVCVMSVGTYSIRCDFAVSEATSTVLATTTDGVSLTTGTAPVFVTGAVANGVVNVGSEVEVPSLTVVGEATTLKLTDTLTATYLYLPATTTIDASSVEVGLPGPSEGTKETVLVSGKISAVTDPSVTLPELAEGYAFEPLIRDNSGIKAVVSRPVDAIVTFTSGGEELNWSDVKPEGWVDSALPTITIDNSNFAGTLVFDEDVQAAKIVISGAWAVNIKRNSDVNVAIPYFTAQDYYMTHTFTDFDEIPATTHATESGDVLTVAGTETLTSFPQISTSDQGATLAIAQKAVFSDSGFYVTGSKTINIQEGADISAARFVLGNNGGVTQVVNQNGGTVTVTGSTAPTSNQASILLGHWGNGSSSTLNTKGGTFTATAAATRLAWDGAATWNIGNGDSTATANVLGIVSGLNSHVGAGTLNIWVNGVLNIGANGINFAHTNSKINLAGGTIKATANTTIANNNTSGTILNSGKNTTIDTDEFEVQLSAPLSGAGTLTKLGSGTLVVTGAGTSTARHEINGGGILRLSGNGATLGTGGFNMKGNGAKLEIVPGEGNVITLNADYLINSTSGNGSPRLTIGPGIVTNDCTGVSQYGQFGQAPIYINDGGVFVLNKTDQLGWNMFTAINVAEGAELVLNAAQRLTRALNLNGGTVTLTGVANPLKTVANRTITVTKDSVIRSVPVDEVENPAITVSDGPLTFNVDAEKTLMLDASIVDGEDEALIGKTVNKNGTGTLTLAKASTATGTLAVNAGTLKLDGGSWAGSVTIAEGAALDVVNETPATAGQLLVAGSFTVSGEVRENGEIVAVDVREDGIYVADATSDTYTVTGETVLDESGSFDVPDGTKTIVLGAYDVTTGFTIDGTKATLNAPEVVEETNKKAIDVGATTVTFNVDLVEGLYYGVASGTGLTFTRPASLKQYDGTNTADILSVNKPSTEKGFFKVFVDIKE